MALGTKNRPDSDVESKRSQSDYDDAFSDIIDQEFGGGSSENPFGYSPKSKSDSTDSSDNDGLNQDNHSDDLNELEDNSVNSTVNETNSQGSTNSEKLKSLMTKIGKSRSPLGVIFSLFGITGVLIFLLFNPASLLTGLSEMLMERNDNVSSSMQRRLLKVIDHTAKNQADHEVCTGSKMRCHMGKFSNSALRKMDRAGVKPLWNGEAKTLSRTGFPDKNPSSYSITKTDGSVDTVQAGQLANYLSDKDNRVVARKMLGSGGAFSMRFRAFSSAHMKKAFYNKFRVGKTGGLADGSKQRQTMAELSQKIQSRIPGADAINQAGARVQDKVGKHLGKSRKGGAAYVIAVVGCVSVKAPKYIAAGVAAIQVAQLVVHVNDFILSPGSKQKAHAFESNITAEDVDSIGTVLNEKYPEKDSEGKDIVDNKGEVVKKSALESPYLLNALGVDDSGPPPSADFTPALAILSSPFYRGAADTEEATRAACNQILSPAAMYTAMAVSAATTALASTTLVGGVAKIAVEFVISALAIEVTKAVVGEAATQVLKEVAENDKIEGAQGKQLGDILGIGAAAYFSGAGMARGLPVLSRGQAKAFNELKLEEENLQREMDIASLSPFDTSSKHTFLGNMVHNTRFAMLKNRAFDNSLGGVVSVVANLPSLALSPKAGAARITDNYGKYAEYADLSANTGNTDDDPCITFALTPCVGLTNQQAAMSTAEAITQAEEEKWFREEDNIAEDIDLFSLLEASNNEGEGNGSGYIKAETPLSDYMESCMDMSTGDYLLNTLGCMAESDAASAQANGNTNEVCITEDGSNRCGNFQAGDSELSTASTKALAARAPLILDFQILQSINGFDDENRQLPTENPGDGEEAGAPDAGAGPVSSEGWTWPLVVGVNPGPCYGRNVGSLGRHAGMDMNSTVARAPILAMKEGVVHSVTSGGAAGNMVMIKTDDNIYYGFQHLSSISVKVNQRVSTGQQVGTGGKTGRVFANDPVHLHITIARSAAVPSYGNLRDSFDPMSVLKGVPAPNGYKCY